MEIIQVKGNTYVLDLGLLYLPFYKISQTDLILLDTGLKKEHQHGGQGPHHTKELHQLFTQVRIIGQRAQNRKKGHLQ